LIDDLGTREVGGPRSFHFFSIAWVMRYPVVDRSAESADSAVNMNLDACLSALYRAGIANSSTSRLGSE
jgi:hypothetical protein